MQEPTSLSRDLNTTYRVADPISHIDLAALGFTMKNRPRCEIRAAWTGEKRCPKKGEWYLSGAIGEAYQAINDLTTEYPIARLVKVR